MLHEKVHIFFIKITRMKTILTSEKCGRELKKSLTLKQKIMLVLCVMENNDLVTDPTDVSNSFNKYYSSIAETF